MNENLSSARSVQVSTAMIGWQRQLRSGVMPDERELSAVERREFEGLLPQAYRLAGLDRESAPSAVAVVRAVNDLIGRLRADALGEEQAVEWSLALGCLLGQQWCTGLGWEWRLVTLGDFEGYGVVSADRRFVYFPMQDIHDLLTSDAGELNLLLLFSMVSAGEVPPASRDEYVSLG